MGINDQPDGLRESHEGGFQVRYNDENIYGGEYKAHFLEQYKVYVEMADRVSARRSQSNNFYISLLSGLLVFLSILNNKDISQFRNERFQALIILTIAILGICICTLWYRNINSYKLLNSGKFRIIQEMEKYLPFPCYLNEWELIKKEPKYRGYAAQTKTEKLVPFVFAVPYLILLIYSGSVILGLKP